MQVITKLYIMLVDC